jgi:hypothetical protein
MTHPVEWVMTDNTREWREAITSSLELRVRVDETGTFTATWLSNAHGAQSLKAKSIMDLRYRLMLEMYRRGDRSEPLYLYLIPEPGVATIWTASLSPDVTAMIEHTDRSELFLASVFDHGYLTNGRAYWPTLARAKKYAEIAMQRLLSSTSEHHPAAPAGSAAQGDNADGPD